MKNIAFFRILMGLVCATALSSQAQPILSIDFNERGRETNTPPGFTSYVISSADGTGAQSNATVVTIGDYTVTLSGNATNITYDDRIRTQPTNNGDFDQFMLLSDVVFCPSTTTGNGLDISIEGLTGGQVYLVRIWSYDNSSTGSRVSDWYAAGTLLRDNYTFDGAVLPTDNYQYQFSFKVTCPESGRLLIQGRRDASSRSGQPGVFINALQLEPTVADPPTIATPPIAVEAYAGEAAPFTVVAGGTAPFTYQWLRNGNFIPDATNRTLLLTNVTPTDVAEYAVIISNAVDYAISIPVSLTVKPVVDITTALVSYWPLDELTSTSPDATTNINDLLATNLTETALVNGYRGNAVSFNGTNSTALLYRDTADVSPELPLYSHAAYTVALWVKGHVTNGPADCRVFSESATNANNPLVNIGTDNRGTNPVVDIFIRNNNGSTPHNHTHSSLVAFDDAWHHITWVDDKGLAARLYVDGVQDTNNFTYTRGTLTTHILSIGGILRSNGMGNWFTGLIDDVAVWGRGLTPEEVVYVMNNGPTPPTPPRVLGFGITNGVVSLHFESAVPGVTHEVEVASDLSVSPPAWGPVTGVTLNGLGGDQFMATFDMPVEPVAQFYRIVRR